MLLYRDTFKYKATCNLEAYHSKHLDYWFETVYTYTLEESSPSIVLCVLKVTIDQQLVSGLVFLGQCRTRSDWAPGKTCPGTEHVNNIREIDTHYTCISADEKQMGVFMGENCKENIYNPKDGYIVKKKSKKKIIKKWNIPIFFLLWQPQGSSQNRRNQPPPSF